MIRDIPRKNMNTSIDNIASAEKFESEVTNFIISTLNLEVSADDIDPDSPLYGNGFGLDSIDVLELALAISQRYGFQMKSDDPKNKIIFSSLRHLASHIATHRTK